MKVILLCDMKKMGKKYDVIEAKSGYATNFLIPSGKAMVADKENLKKVAKIKENIFLEKNSKKDGSLKIKEKIESKPITIIMKAHESGKLFGSITSKEVSEKIEKEYKILIDKKRFKIPSISNIGKYSAQIKLEEGVNAEIEIIVEPEK